MNIIQLLASEASNVTAASESAFIQADSFAVAQKNNSVLHWKEKGKFPPEGHLTMQRSGRSKLLAQMTYGVIFHRRSISKVT